MTQLILNFEFRFNFEKQMIETKNEKNNSKFKLQMSNQLVILILLIPLNYEMLF